MQIIRAFVNHRLAANLGMMLMMLAGLWAITQIDVRLNPAQRMPYVDASVSWRGAGSEDVEKLVTTPLEQQIKTLPDVESVWSVTRDGHSFVRVQVDADADVQGAVDAIKQRIGQIRSFPPEVEQPNVYAVRQRELVAAVLVTGRGSLGELIPIARQMRGELLGRGIDSVSFSGLPSEHIAIEVDSRTLLELDLTFNELGAQLAALSTDAPGGSIGAGDLARRIRGLDQRRDADAFASLPVRTGAGALVRLGDIARVELRPLEDAPYLTVGGEPAIALFVRRDTRGDSLEAAENLQSYLDAKRETLPEGIEFRLFLEAWGFIRDELELIVGNGLMGLALVIVALLAFLRFLPAFWVMMGIPATFLAALLGFYYLGGTINVVSLIGFIMALGIVVDDAIVVGEESLTRFDAGLPPAEASAAGAARMMIPVAASSLTTLCAFMPLLASGDLVVREIAIAMVVVVGASLIECFLILPGHLRHAFERTGRRPAPRWQQRFATAFERFREQRFRRFARLAMANRGIVVAGAFGLFIVALLAWTNGWIKTELSVSIDFDEVRADVRFAPGATGEEKRAFMAHLEDALAAADAAAGGGNLVMHVVAMHSARIDNEAKTGAQFASIHAELASPEKRDIDADRFAASWLAKVRRAPSVDALGIERERSWSSDFSILLKGDDAQVLKRAGEDVIRELMALEGVSNLRDNLPWGADQWLLRLTTAGRALGLSTRELGRQLRAAYDGRLIQIFQEADSELEVRLLLPRGERGDLSRLGAFPVKTPDGAMLPLATLADIETRRGIDAIRHHNGQRTVSVRGDVDISAITGREVVAYFNERIRDRVVREYGIGTGLDELSLAEDRAGREMLVLFGIALALIYIVLAWVFASWSWPLAVMAAIPLGITGAIAGHLALGLHINSMSLLGLFTLTGIVVNDSIILVSAYKRLVAEGVAAGQAIEDAVCARLRPVILTSATTIAGLFPLLLEQSPIGAMFKPLAVAICFGLLYGTVLVLLVIPVLLSLLVGGSARMARLGARLRPRAAVSG